MANDLSAIMPKILARSLESLRELCVMPRVVNGDYSTEAKELGDTIDVPIPTAVGTRTVTPAAVKPASTDATPTKVQVPLDQWKQNDPFALSDKDLLQVDANQSYLPMQSAEAIKALANLVNVSIHGTYKGIFGATGTAGVTPFATTTAAAANVRKLLNKQLAPKKDRRVVQDHDSEANMLQLATFSDAEKIGTNEVKIEGEIGRKYGMDWYADDAVVTHTAGTGAAYVTNGIQAVGATSIVLKTGSGTLVVGDIITFAGHTQTYAVTTGIAAPGTAVIYPGLKVQVADGVAVTVTATHVVNLAFHRDAIAFATRPLLGTSTQFGDLGGAKILSMQDPQTGLILRLQVSRQHMQIAWEYDILWGVKLVRPELAVRMLG